VSWPIVAAFALGILGGCEPGWSQPAPDRATERRVLPPPQRSGGPTLASVLAARRSMRVFGRRALEDAELGQLLWAGQGVSDGHRTAPSAGGLYPITVRVADARGVWRYVPADHVLVRETATDQRAELAAASFRQGAVATAPTILIISAEIAVTAHKYGARAERYATLEAGHVAENILLAATALGLGGVPVGAFDDAAVHRVLDLPASVTTLYVLPIGALP
jgi:SagB-type dehydrogenase family enzyme